jgi:hypothetical protein
MGSPGGSEGEPFEPPGSSVGLGDVWLTVVVPEEFELPLEELLEPGVQPIRKRSAAPARTDARFSKRVADMTSLYSNSTYARRANLLPMMPQRSIKADFPSESLAIAMPQYGASEV